MKNKKLELIKSTTSTEGLEKILSSVSVVDLINIRKKIRYIIKLFKKFSNQSNAWNHELNFCIGTKIQIYCKMGNSFDIDKIKVPCITIDFKYGDNNTIGIRGSIDGFCNEEEFKDFEIIFEQTYKNIISK